MAAPTLVYDATLNLNDGATWTLREGFDPGERLKTWDERRSYSGAVAQYNVTEANLIPMYVPLEVTAASVAALRAAVDALNTIIDAGAADLVYNEGPGAVTYHCVESNRVSYPRTNRSQLDFRAHIDFRPWRTP